MTRFVILGAGAIGGGIGGLLARSGADVVLVARGEHLRTLRRRGIRLRTPEQDVTVPVTAVGGPDELQLHRSDVLVVATKTHQALGILAQWADAEIVADGTDEDGSDEDGSDEDETEDVAAPSRTTAGERLPVLMALNGVASEQLALRYFSRVFGICVWMPAVHLEPGEVILRGTPVAGTFHIGRVPAGAATPADRSLLRAVESDWSAAGFTVVLPEDVMPWKYRKLLSNVGNAFQALVGTNGDPAPLVRAAEVEARQVLDAASVRYTDDEEERAARARSFRVAPVPGEPPELGGSTWQSLTRGTGDVESDYLNGEIAQIAHRHGLTAPLNARVARLARQAAASGARPGDVSAAELAVTLGLAKEP